MTARTFLAHIFPGDISMLTCLLCGGEGVLVPRLAAQGIQAQPHETFVNLVFPLHEGDLQFFAAALEGSNIVMPKDLAPYLPKLLWLYQMGLILFWISDRSPDQVRTRQLREKSLALLGTALKLAAFPLLRPLRKKIVELLMTIEGNTHDGETQHA